MKLQRFRVTNYRSVKDSGWIDAAQQTALVGRNESGKSNLLLALRSLRPPDGLQRLSVATDFPAERSRAEYSDELDVVRAVWSLEPEEQELLGQIFPRAREVTRVEVGRGYEPLRWVLFEKLPPVEAPVDRAKELCNRLLESAVGGDGAPEPELERALRATDQAVGRPAKQPRLWAENVREVLGELRQAVRIHGNEAGADALTELCDLVDQVAHDGEAEHAARDWVLQQLPTFLYLDDYPEISGEQDLAAFVERRREGRSREGDEYFEKLLVVAGLDPATLDSLLSSDHETRRQIANRAGAAVTRRLRELWNERALKVRFNLDGANFNTLISDPSSIYDVEINLNERSKGFRWFFSFYVTFAADAKTGNTDNIVLLLDEPGLHLHALGQRDLLAHFKADFPNQVVFSTHSPFMVPSHDIGSVRTVTISEEEGTRAFNTPSGDPKTLFPILHSFGVEVSQGLFRDEWTLAVSELSDYWYLRAASDYLREKGGRGLPKSMRIAPAGDAARIPYLVGLLAGEHQRAIVMLEARPGDAEGKTLPGAAEWLDWDNALFLGELLGEGHTAGADIEDLFEPELYDRFVRYCWRAELAGKTLEPDPAIPRVVERYAKALGALGIEFSRARPARLFLRGMGKNPATVFPKATRQNFEKLFAAVHEKLAKLEV